MNKQTTCCSSLSPTVQLYSLCEGCLLYRLMDQMSDEQDRVQVCSLRMRRIQVCSLPFILRDRTCTGV